MTSFSAIDARAPSRARTRGGFVFQDLPLRLVMAYLLAVFTAFLVWPINWPIYNIETWLALVAYVAVCYLALVFCYRFGRSISGPAMAPARPFPVGPLLLIGAALAVVLLFPSALIYTGRWPWEVLAALQDQGEAYRTLQYQLLETAGGRVPMALARALFAPLTFAVLPLGILYWRHLNWLLRGAVIAAASCAVILSILRGTDRELADMFIVSGSAFLILLGRSTSGGAKATAIIRKYWLPAVLLALFVWVAAGLATDRKSQRLGGYENRVMVCANDSRICADVEAPFLAWMPDEQRFGLSIFVLSSASGYYGLALGMEQEDFLPTFGIGHSPATLAMYELVTGDREFRTRTYTYRNGLQGWNDENYWSTLMLWLANDFGFAGALAVLCFLGFIWGRTWRDATQRGSDAAAVIFCQTMVMLVYLPANNQVFAIYDGYIVFFTWLAMWRYQVSRRSASSALQAS